MSNHLKKIQPLFAMVALFTLQPLSAMNHVCTSSSRRPGAMADRPGNSDSEPGILPALRSSESEVESGRRTPGESLKDALNSQLFKKVEFKTSYPSEIKQLLKDGAQVNARNEKKRTPLMVSMMLGSEAIWKLLLEHGANLNDQDEDGETALAKATRFGRINACQLLLLHGANPNTQDVTGATPLSRAAIYRGGYEICKLLLAYGANPNIQNRKGVTALLFAAELDCKETCKLLIEVDADTNQQNKQGTSPLMLAAQNGSKEICKLLLNHGASMWGEDACGTSILLSPYDESSYLRRAARRQAKLFAALVAKDQNTLHEIGTAWPELINAPYHKGITPLSAAIDQESFKNCLYLITLGANVNAKTRKGRTILEHAQRTNNQRIIELITLFEDETALHDYSQLLLASIEGEHAVLLTRIHHEVYDFFKLKKIKELATKCPTICKKITAPEKLLLHKAVCTTSYASRQDLCEALLALGVNINARDAEGRTALMWATHLNDAGLCEFLCKKGASVNLEDKKGFSALKNAAAHGYSYLCRILLRYGADAMPCSTEDCLNIPLFWAANNGHLDTCSLLARYSSIDTQNKLGSTPLMRAVDEGHLAVAEFLLSQQANPNVSNKAGMTPLMNAAANNNTAIARALIAHGADLNTQINGATALTHALASKKAKFTHFMLQKGCNPQPEDFQFCIENPYLCTLLITHKADPNSTNALGYSPLMFLVKGISKKEPVDPASVQVLLDAGANVNHQAHHGETALMCAAEENRFVLCKLLLSHGANPYLLTEKNHSALAFAHENLKPIFRDFQTEYERLCTALEDEDEILPKIIERNGSPAGLLLNRPNEFGITPLMRAAQIGSYATCCLLLKAGACSNLKDYDNHTAHFHALHNRHLSIARLLHAHAQPPSLHRSALLTLLYQSPAQRAELIGQNRNINNESFDAIMSRYPLLLKGAEPNYLPPSGEEVLEKEEQESNDDAEQLDSNVWEYL